jgi:hypothetical protein
MPILSANRIGGACKGINILGGIHFGVGAFLMPKITHPEQKYNNIFEKSSFK